MIRVGRQMLPSVKQQYTCDDSARTGEREFKKREFKLNLTLDPNREILSNGGLSLLSDLTF